MNRLPTRDSENAITDNLERMKGLFPEAFTEGRLDFGVLRELLGGSVDADEEKYGLYWHGQRRARQLALAPSTGTLRPCPEQSVAWDSTRNVMIEGDNLEVLKILQKSYSGKVKLIYIDPPYNTGKDFVYPDDYRDTLTNYLQITGQVDGENQRLSSNLDTSGRFHTAWLNMMYPRIKACRSLLKDDGLLFISSDDVEIHNLRQICNNLFGEECFVGCISRVTGTPTGGGNKALVGEIDYVLVFSKSPRAVIEGVNFTEADAQIYTKEDAQGRYLTRTIRRTGGEDRREDRPSMFYPITAPDGTQVLPMGPSGYESRWICGRERFEELEKSGLIEWIKADRGDAQEWQVHQKYYLEGRKKQPSNFWSRIEGNKKATRDLRAMFDGEKVFSSPKPVGLIQHIIELSSLSDDDIVLDFFAGSGTTAQAVWTQNGSDGIRRRFILVQLPEPLSERNNREQAIAAAFCRKTGKPCNIAEITKERLRRAAEHVRRNEPVHLGDLGFRVFKLDRSNIRVWDPASGEVEQSLFEAVDHVQPDRTEQDILTELLLKLGLDLCVPIESRVVRGKSVFSIGDGTLVACLAEAISSDEVEPLAIAIADWQDEVNPAGETTAVFRDAAFVDDVAKTNLGAILAQRGLEKIRSL